MKQKVCINDSWLEWSLISDFILANLRIVALNRSYPRDRSLLTRFSMIVEMIFKADTQFIVLFLTVLNGFPNETV